MALVVFLMLIVPSTSALFPDISKIKDINIPSHQNWTVGFLTPDEDTFDENGMDIIIYNFASVDDKDYLVTLTFQEYYWNFQILLCMTEKVSPKDALRIPLSHHNSSYENPFGGDSNKCTKIDLSVNDPVINNYRGPVFLEIIFNKESGKPPHRRHANLEGDKKEYFYNFTYAMKYIEDPVNYTNADILKTRYPCNLNGIPVLHQSGESLYKFECACHFSTYGYDCQWGKRCNDTDQRTPCSNYGTCREFDQHLMCTCDPEYHNNNHGCQHYTRFELRSGDFCGQRCQSCHVLPNNKTKCLCDHGFHLVNGSCIRDKADFLYTLSRNTSVEDLEIEMKHLLTCSNVFENASYEMSFDTELRIISFPDIPNRAFGKLNDERFLKSMLNQTCSLYSGNDRINGTLIRSLVPTTESGSRFIRTFKSEIIDKNLEVCCYAIIGEFNTTFYKDEHVINPVPINSREAINGRLTWKSGSYTINFDNGSENRFCLLVDEVSPLDYGNYECQMNGSDGRNESRILSVHPEEKLIVQIEPRSITIFEGETASLACIIHKTGSYTNISFACDIVPKVALDTHTIFTERESKYNVTLHNVTKDAKITCSATANSREGIAKLYDEKTISLYIIRSNLSYCEDDAHLDLIWGSSRVDNSKSVLCPEGYKGICKRMCAKEPETEYATWDIPDCSDCKRNIIYKFFEKLLMYKRGLYSSLKRPDRAVKELNVILNATTFLPGEAGSLVKQLNEFFMVDNLRPTYDEFWTTVDILLNRKYGFVENDLEHLESLIRKRPWKTKDQDCLQGFSKKRNLVSYHQNRITDSISPGIDFTIPFPAELSLLPTQSRCWKLGSLGNVRLQVEANLNISTLNSILFWNPGSFLPYLKKVEGSDCTLHSSFSQVTSPIVQINAYNDGHSVNTTEITTTVLFSSCNLEENLSSSWQLDCGRYLPDANLWNFTGCETRTSTDGSCACSCKGTAGWIGLVCSYKWVQKSNDRNWVKDYVTAAACSVSIVILAASGYFIIISSFKDGGGSLSGFIDVGANLAINGVFLYDALKNSQKEENIGFLIIVSCCFVLSLSMGVSHQISFLQKCSIKNNNSIHLPSQLTYSSFLVIIIAIVTTTMLGIIVWMISKVESISLSCFWLPNNDAQSLTVAVFLYISFSILLLIALSCHNFFRVRHIKCHSAASTKSSLYAELRRYCLLYTAEFLFIMLSIYRSTTVGRYFCAFSDLTLSLLFLYTYILPRRSRLCSSVSMPFRIARNREGDDNNKWCCLLRLLFPPYDVETEANRLDSSLPSFPSRQQQPHQDLSQTSSEIHGANHEERRNNVEVARNENFDSNSNISTTPRYLHMKRHTLEMKPVKRKQKYKHMYCNYRKSSTDLKISMFGNCEAETYCTMASEPHSHGTLNHQLQPNRNIYGREEDFSGISSDSYSAGSSGKSYVRTAKSVHSSPFLCADKGKGFIQTVSSKLSLIASKTKTPKKSFGSARIMTSYEQLEGGEFSGNHKIKSTRDRKQLPPERMYYDTQKGLNKPKPLKRQHSF